MNETASSNTEFASASDARFMDHALALAARGVALASPNPMVGAVLVRDGGVLGEGFHTYEGVRHAEIVALEAARNPSAEGFGGFVDGAFRHDNKATRLSGVLTPEGGSDVARGATLYVTLEPCCHTGRTGPCTQALVNAGIARVMAAMEDPNPAVTGRGFKQLRAAGIEVSVGLRKREAQRLNEAFAKWIVTRRPLVTLKSALTLDGHLVLPYAPGRARPALKDRWISSAESREEVQRMRHASDALLTGIGTILEDDPLLTDRTGLPRRRKLLRVVMDSRLRLPVRSRLVQSADGDVVVFTRASEISPKARALLRAGVQIVRIAGRGSKPDLRTVIAELGRREILSVLLEAGRTLNSAALSAGIVDKMRMFFGPKVAGFGAAGFEGRRSRAATASNGIRGAQELQNVTMAQFGPDFAIEGYLHDVTGLVEHVGTIESLELSGAGGRIRVNAGLLTDGLSESGSIAVNGCCLTAVDIWRETFAADLSGETLQRTSLGEAKAGAQVNLERPLTAMKELGGHFVQGHVDGIGRVARLDREGGSWWFGVRVPDDLARYVAMKGSIALDGISLTVAGWHDGIVETAIIPFTYEHTNLSSLQAGDAVNIECDVLAKYVERLMEARKETEVSRLSVARLIEEGF